MKKIIPIIIILILITIFFLFQTNNNTTHQETTTQMPALKSIKDIETFKENYPNININISYTYNEQEKDTIIYQSIKENENLTNYNNLDLTISLGAFNSEQMKTDKINELGSVPIMMYHGIVNMKSSETNYIGGNVDKDGYTRTTEAFINDLEYYYQNNYRMIRLEDYINGEIKTEYGKSPIILTFDDGNENNIKVTGLDEEGNIIIDPNSAVGILEQFKEKYPDYNVTATFFVNDTLFNQEEYNEKILTWLIDNGYDIGNHTKGHIDIKKEDATTVNNSIGYVYNQLDSIIPDKYVNIIALPFGSPYNKEHSNFQYVLNSTYNNKTYNTTSALRVGWEPELSPYDKNFDPTFLKRCRAYDNNGEEFDITMVFNILETTRYISDGVNNTIVIPCNLKDSITETNSKEVLCY